MDSINKLAALRVKKSKKTPEELVAQTTGPYEEVRLDDPLYEEKAKLKRKTKPFYDRLKDKQS